MPRSRIAFTMSTTALVLTSPSKGQPKAVAMAPWTAMLGARDRLADVGEAFQRLPHRPVDVLPVVRLRGGDEEDDAVDAGLERPLGALHVRHERQKLDVRTMLDAGDDLHRVPKLGHGAGRHEARHLERAQAGVDQAVDQPDLGVGRDEGLFHLEAVARADLGDTDAARQPFHRLFLQYPGRWPGMRAPRSGVKPPRAMVWPRLLRPG